MDEDLFQKIRDENIVTYGTGVSVYGPTLLAKMYSDRTHFIYELMQNAEDACERQKQAHGDTDFFLRFKLYPDKLTLIHNGIPFDDDDIVGICGIVAGTKTNDPRQIGKFGIGFKSVYAYTTSPEIYNGSKSFCIRNYVLPFPIQNATKLGERVTRMVIPFNVKELAKGLIFEQISNRLKNIGLTNILFLHNISQIEWEVEGHEKGSYLRDSTSIGQNIRKVELSFIADGEKEKVEKWLVFERSVPNHEPLKIEIAFRLDTIDKKERIVPYPGAKLAAFFLTEKDTYLRFLIQGPYKTTPARDNIIANDDWNTLLVEETATLLAEAIPVIKELGFLDVGFLKVLPLERDMFLKVNEAFSPIFLKVKEKFQSDEALLPADQNKYVSSGEALLARGDDLIELISPLQIQQLFGKSQWLNSTITRDRTPEIRQYLMEELKIQEIDPEQFGRTITAPFLVSQSDSWIGELYAFLHRQPALWRKKGYLPEGVFRSKPIIRLTDNKHVQPFDGLGNPLAYLPISIPNFTGFPIIKPTVVQKTEAKEFLSDLDIRAPDMADVLGKAILPKYKFQKENITADENKKDLKWICNFLKTDLVTEERKRVLLQELKQTSFLFAQNFNTGKGEYRKPTDIHIGSQYTKTNDLDTYFNGNINEWKLDSRYTDLEDIASLEKLGCKSQILVLHSAVNYFRYVIIRDLYGSHKRGLDGFDSEGEIEGLEYALRNITLGKSEIIWGILKNNYNLIYGDVEISSRGDFMYPKKESVFSKMGKLLSEYAWLPLVQADKTVFLKACDISLSDLPSEYDAGSLASKNIAEKLNFKTLTEEVFLNQLPEEDKNIYVAIRNLPQEDKKRIWEVLEDLKNKVAGPTETTIEEITDDLKKLLEGKDESEIIGEHTETLWTGLSPEEEQKIRLEYGKSIADKLKGIKVKLNTNLKKEPIIVGLIEPREFLRAEYGGHCQICNTKLDLGQSKNSYFETLRLLETQNRHWWANMEFNIMCLCPNCHAQIRRGSRDLKNIWYAAEKVNGNELAPEPVKERHGDFYIIKIKVTDTEKEIYYSPTHMAKLAAVVSQSFP
jgi:hypothetical protein